MKIVIILGAMIHGGAHRVACLQASEFAERGYDVTLLLVVGADKFPYEISPKVKIINALPAEELEFSGLRSKLRRKLLAIPCIIKLLKIIKPDLVISHIQGTNREAIISSRILNIPIIVCEHTSHHLPQGWRGKIAYFERRYIYKLSNKVITLTEYDVDSFYGKFLKNVTTIPNPCPFDAQLLKLQEDRKKNILAVGDLNRIHIKGWDNALRVFSMISADFPDWKFQFAGAGEDGKKLLEKLASEYNILDKVEFLGSVIDVKYLLQNTSVFLLSSRNEGLPMALIEAISQGCACIAFNCKTGPSDIIINGTNGILVKDQDCVEMANKLGVLLHDVQLRSIYSSAAIESAKKFSKTQVFDRLEKIIREVTKKRKP